MAGKSGTNKRTPPFAGTAVGQQNHCPGRSASLVLRLNYNGLDNFMTACNVPSSTGCEQSNATPAPQRGRDGHKAAPCSPQATSARPFGKTSGCFEKGLKGRKTINPELCVCYCTANGCSSPSKCRWGRRTSGSGNAAPPQGGLASNPRSAAGTPRGTIPQGSTGCPVPCAAR